MKNYNKYLVVPLLYAMAVFALTACGGGNDSDDFRLGAGNSTDGDNPNIINGFDLRTAQLLLDGPDVVGVDSRRNYTATLLDVNGIPPASPPGIRIEFDIPSGRSTNPPGGDLTNADGEVDFTYNAPDNSTEAIVRVLVFNADDERVLDRGITVSVQNTLFQFTSPVEDAQIRLGEARAIQLNWLIGSTGATTNNASQNNPSAVSFTLSGRPAGGGFRLNGGALRGSVTVNVASGEIEDTLEVVAGDSAGEVNIIATATTDNETLQATLPVVFVGEPTRIEPTPTNILISQQAAQPLEVRVFDEFGTALSDIPLRFRISICIDGQRNTIICNGSGEEITRELRTTDSDGQARTGFIAGSTNGGGEIEITVVSGPGAGLETAIVYNVSN